MNFRQYGPQTAYCSLKFIHTQTLWVKTESLGSRFKLMVLVSCTATKEVIVLQMFRRSSSALVGVDISSTSIKLLELSKQATNYRVESYTFEPLPANAVVENDIKEVEVVGEAIGRAVKKAGVRTTNAAAAVAGSAVITKIIQMPADLSEEEMESQIELEADRHIPYPIEEVNCDFEVIGACSQDANYVDVLLACSHRGNVDLRVGALEIGGLKAKVVDIEAYAMERAYSLLAGQLPEYGDNKTVAVIDIGATMTSVNVLHNHMTVYTREQVFGGKQLTEEIQRRYGYSLEEATLAKHEDNLPEDYYLEVLEPFKEAVTQQVSRSLQFFFSASEYDHIDHLILAGGTVAIPDICHLVAQKIDTPVSIANPFEEMSVSSKVNKNRLDMDASALMICAGLAMRSFS